MTTKKKMKTLTRDEILAKVHAKVEHVEVPEWGALIKVRPPTWPMLQRLRMEHKTDEDFQFAMLCACCVDLKPEDIRNMMTGNGMRYGELLNAVMGENSPINDAIVGKPKSA